MTLYQCISMEQPAANEFALGRRSVDIRTWSTGYRGEILIASFGNPRIPPAGFAIAVGKLAECRAMAVADEPAAASRWFGGAIAWVFAELTPIAPFKLTSQLGLYAIKRPEPVRPITVDEYALYLRMENSRA